MATTFAVGKEKNVGAACGARGHILTLQPANIVCSLLANKFEQIQTQKSFIRSWDSSALDSPDVSGIIESKVDAGACATI